MPKTEKSMLKSYQYIGIHSIKPIAETEWNHPTFGHSVGFTTKSGNIEPIGKEGRETFYALHASHEITLVSDKWHWNFQTPGDRILGRYRHGQPVRTKRDGVEFADPNQKVGMIIWARRKYLGRNPGSAFIYSEDKLYHIYSWKDVIGNNSKESRMCKSRSNRMVIWAQERTTQETQELIELFQKEQTPSGRF